MTKQELIENFLPDRVTDDLGTSIEVRKARLKSELEFLDKEERLRNQDLAKMIVEARSEGKVGSNNRPNSYILFLLGLTTKPPDFSVDYEFRIDCYLTRYSDPDVDVDFEDNTIIYDYIINKYGKDRVANIGTYNQWKVRAAIQNACKYLRVQLPNMTISETAIAISSTVDSRAKTFELATCGNDCQQYREMFPEVFEKAKKILGIKSHVGKHAAGIVISDVPIVEYTPIHRASESEFVTQYDMNDLEELGLLKMDILAVKTLKVIHMTIDLIKSIKGIDLHPWKVNPDDLKVFSMISRGLTCGIFQFEAYGITQFLKQMRPSNFEDIVAASALYRPGPKDNGYHLEYVERKKDESKRVYPHESLSKILEKTFGLFIYQEQLMKATEILAGFSATEADELRKIIGKKQTDKLPQMAEKFISRCKSHGLITEDHAIELWDQFEKFGSYCFNRSHSVAYTLISYLTGALKLYFPKMFYASLMSVELHYGGAECEQNLIKYEKEANRNFKIDFLPVDINKSKINYSIDGDNIRIPIGSIKGIGVEVQKEICAKQPFKNFEDFYSKCNSRSLTTAVIENLIENNVFSEFGKKDNIKEEYKFAKAKSAMSKRNSSSSKSLVPNMKMLI